MIKRSGLFWPDVDKQCYKAVPGEMHKIKILMEEYVKKTDVCIQAGGNVGMFAKELANYFKAVYTFEPDPDNFTCLAMNCPEHNIVKFNAALGSHHALIHVGASVPREADNCGAYQVLGTGIYPTMLVDDLGLEACDLMYLDIEGYELFALQGAYNTIKAFHPVIVVENKVLPLMFDVEPEQVLDFLVKEFDYVVKEKVMRDVILI